MNDFFRNSTFLKYFWGLMGLYLLNISVDSPDLYPDYISEDLNFNDQESMVEILVEKVLGYGDVFEEYDDPDKEDHNSRSSFKFKLTVHPTTTNYSHHDFLFYKKKKFQGGTSYFTQMYLHLDTPPPEV